MQRLVGESERNFKREAKLSGGCVTEKAMAASRPTR